MSMRMAVRMMPAAWMVSEGCDDAGFKYNHEYDMARGSMGLVRLLAQLSK